MRKNLILYTNVVGGALVLLSYVLLLPRTLPDGHVEPLWFGIDGWTRRVFYGSITVTVITYLWAMAWLNQHAIPAGRLKYTYAYAVTLVGALSWTVALFLWGRLRHIGSLAKALTAAGVALSLLVITLGAWWLAWEAHQNHTPRWVLLFVCFYVFHVTVLDNGVWLYAFVVGQ